MKAKKQHRSTPPLSGERRLVDWLRADKQVYIAVSKHGYGIHEVAAAAIRLAQVQIPARAKPSTLLIYKGAAGIEPTGYGEWSNGDRPRLVGLVSTHQGFKQKNRYTT